jgi:hypothetical protein
MALLNALGQQIAALRGIVWPTYQPERHYMRGPGPACEKRSRTVH